MDWDVYNIFSIFSGTLLLACAFLTTLALRARILFPLFGAANIAYGIYEGVSDSGTFFFNDSIFVLPLIAIGMIAFEIYTRRTQSSEVMVAASQVHELVDTAIEPRKIKVLDRRCTGVACSKYFTQVFAKTCDECGDVTQLHPLIV